MFYLVDKETGQAICKTEHKRDLQHLMASVTYQYWEIIEA